VNVHRLTTSTEAADRSWSTPIAHCADRRDAEVQMALFTEDTHFVVYMDAQDPAPKQDLHGRQALAPVFDALNSYVATMHFNGQSTIKLRGPGDRRELLSGTPSDASWGRVPDADGVVHPLPRHVRQA
jgi:hypothetical protein